MNTLLSILQLIFNLVKGVLLSGLGTARVILTPPEQVRPGLTRMPYGELEPGAASLLAALLCLTPGTTTVTIDLKRRELLLHLLDLRHRDETVAAIQRDFLTPIRRIRGEGR